MNVASAATLLPHFIFIAPAHLPPRPGLCDAWRGAICRYFPDDRQADEMFTVREGRLLEMDPAELRCDCIVSPANAFGIMDGGFDLDLSKAFQGTSADIYHLTDHVQSQLRTRWGGFAPPGTCTLVGVPSDGRNAWGTHTLAVLPTMKQPEEVGWNKELVYNGMWALLCAIAARNVAAGGGETAVGTDSIRRVVMTGLGTGAGGISAERCALQMVLAVKHYVEGLPTVVRWETGSVERRMREVGETTCK